jgi:hypothetical protein
MLALIVSTPISPDYVLALSTPEDAYTLDTREMRAALGEVGLDAPEVVAWMRESMREGIDAALPDLRAETAAVAVAPGGGAHTDSENTPK